MKGEDSEEEDSGSGTRVGRYLRGRKGAYNGAASYLPLIAATRWLHCITINKTKPISATTLVTRTNTSPASSPSHSPIVIFGLSGGGFFL